MTTHFNVSTYALQNLTLHWCSGVSHTLIIRMSIKIKDSDQKKYISSCITELYSDRNCNATVRDNNVKM